MKLKEELSLRDNNYDVSADPNYESERFLSIVIPSRNMEYSLGLVLDALMLARGALSLEVIVVDDCSTDASFRIAGSHPSRPIVVRTPKRWGPSIARNLGTVIAKGEIILFLDADMLLPPDAVLAHALSGGDGRITIGFRHNIALSDPRAKVPVESPNLEADHRINWAAGPGKLLYSGLTLDHRVSVRPVEATNDLRELGFGKYFYDWDLPRMVVSAMVAVPRAAALEVGGYDPDFADGWGVEDTHFGAKLIAMGLKVVPLKHTVGFHIDPPNPEDEWRAKLVTWPRNIAIYKAKLEEEFSLAGSASFVEQTSKLLSLCERYGQ